MAARDLADRSRRKLRWFALLTPWLVACAGTGPGRLEIPALSGGERVVLPWRPTPDALAERASAERARDNLAAAERFARWALSADPEHPGALVEAARTAAAKADKTAEPSLRVRELDLSRRLYELAALSLTSPGAARTPKLLGELAEEHDRTLLSLAETEHALGRLEQASALLVPLDATGLAPRARRLALHEALADAFIIEGGLLEAKDHADATSRLGANLTRTRLREAALGLAGQVARDLATPPATPSGEALAEARRKVEAQFGQSAELFRELALLLRRTAPAQGRWAATRAVALDPRPENLAVEVELEALASGPAAGVARARELIASAGDKSGPLVGRFAEALRLVAPRDAAALAEDGAAHPKISAPEALDLALWALETMPTAERPAALKRLFGADAPNAERLFSALEATPGRFAALARHALASGDKQLANRAAALVAQRVPAAALLELEIALEVGVGDAPIDARLARLASHLRSSGGPQSEDGDDGARSEHEGLGLSRDDPRMRGLLSLELLASRGRAELWRPERDGAGLPAAAEIAGAWRESAKGRSDLAAQKFASLDIEKDPLAALARARWLAQGARSHEAVSAWAQAVALAPAALEAATLGLAIESLWPLVLADRLDRGPFEELLGRWLTASASTPPGRAALALLEELTLSTRLSASARLMAVERLHRAGVGAGIELRAQLLGQLPADTPDLDDRLEAAAIARIALTAASPRPGAPNSSRQLLAERLAEEALRQQRVELALRLYARVPASALERVDNVVDLVKLMAGRGEPERARRYARAVLARTDPTKSVASGRMTSLGDALAEMNEWALARECYDRAQTLGDRSSRPLLGAIRASLRLGDEAGADRVANQWIASRPTRDARVYDELSQLFLSEGRLERALELTRARVPAEQLGRPDRPSVMDGNVFVAIAELLKRGGQHDALSAEASAFAESDVRGSHRAHVLGAQKLLEIGRPREALELVQLGLAVRPRDSSLLSAALTAALAARDPKAENLATRLLTEAPATWDLWARVLEDVRASGQGEAALRLAELGLQRAPGQSRLLLMRGRLQLSLGLGDAALTDFAEGLARADEPRQAMSQIEEALQQTWQDERLATVTARALALTPGRADLTLAHADALIAAGRDAEAQRLLARFLAESDRGHAAVAATWFGRGFLGRALDHWTRGFDQLDDREAVETMALVGQSLASSIAITGAGGSAPSIGQDRVEMLERLFVQTQRGTKSPSLMPLGQLHTLLGDRSRALGWLERADLENPTVDTARALFEHHLAELSQEPGATSRTTAPRRAESPAELALLAHGERAISRSQAAAAPGRGIQNTIAVLQLLTDQLIERNRPELAAALATRSSRHVQGLAPRLIAARALLRAGRLGDALGQLGEPFPPWRTNREALTLLGRLAEDLIEAGHAEAALGLLTRGDPRDKERELRLARLRVAVRAGHPERALMEARQLAAEQPALNQWLVAEALSAERMPRVGAWLALDAISQGLTGNVRDRATRVLAVSVGLPAALEASPRLRADRWERAGVAARLGLGLAGTEPASVSQGPRGTSPASGASAMSEALSAAHRAFLEALRAGPLDPQTTWSALGLAGLLDLPGLADLADLADLAENPERAGPRVSATLDAIASHASSHGKQLEESGRALAALGLADPARRVLVAARESHPGHLPLALETARAILASGRPRELASLLGRGFSGVESPSHVARMEVLALAAAHGESKTALELLASELPEAHAAPASAVAPSPSIPQALVARVRVLALATADAPLWDEAIASWLAAAPDESVARVEVARHLLVTTSPHSADPARAMALLEPLLATRRAPRRALELGLVAAMRARELQRATSLMNELAERFPGPPLEAALLVEAALVAGHPPLLSAVLENAPIAQVHEVLDAFARQRASRPPSSGRNEPASRGLPNLAELPASVELLGARLSRPSPGLSLLGAAPADPRPSPLETQIMLQLALGQGAEAASLAATAQGAAPSSERAALLQATTLARSGGSSAEAARLLTGLGHALRGSLMETEARLLAPAVNPRLHLARAELHLEVGENAQALQAWRRHRIEVTPRPVSQPPLRAPAGRPPWAPAPDPFFATPEAAAHLSFGLALADRAVLSGDELRGFLASCVAAQRAPWSGLCRSRLAR